MSDKNEAEIREKTLRKTGDYQELARSYLRHILKHGYSQSEYRRYGGTRGIHNHFPKGGERIKARQEWAQRQIDLGMLDAPDGSELNEKLIQYLKKGGHFE